MRSIIFTTLALVSLSALATEPTVATDPCDTAIDLRKTSLLNLPSGEQGESYACGYFTAATFLDSFRLQRDGKLDSQPIDPIGLGIDLAIKKDRPRWLPLQITTDPLSEKTGHTGSNLCDIIDYVRENGVCDSSDPRVLSRDWMHLRSNQGLELYRALNRFARHGKRKEKKELAELTVEIRKLVANESGIPQTDDALSKLIWENRKKPYRTIRALLYPQCGEKRAGRIFESLPSCKTEWFAGWGAVGLGKDTRKSERIARAIHDRLENQTSLPVPVLHCFQVFREGNAYKTSSPFSGKCIMHYSSVIGRRKKDGVCQFLVRNSYDPTDEYAVSKDWERDGPDFWVDAAAYARSTYGLHRLEARSK